MLFAPLSELLGKNLSDVLLMPQDSSKIEEVRKTSLEEPQDTLYQFDLNLEWCVICVIFAIVTQCFGHRFTGLTCRYLVRPPTMLWPSNLATIAMLNQLHGNDDPSNGRYPMSRYKSFCGQVEQHRRIGARLVFSWSLCWLSSTITSRNTDTHGAVHVMSAAFDCGSGVATLVIFFLAKYDASYFLMLPDMLPDWLWYPSEVERYLQDQALTCGRRLNMNNAYGYAYYVMQVPDCAAYNS
ncbi:hypothetical protein BC830DRAFT_1169899 [Chytriomyces sp. MP71]|nr:hypothetical protein BC830DRAFT_1169899 [Chytriomyces sp. MP71]